MCRVGVGGLFFFFFPPPPFWTTRAHWNCSPISNYTLSPVLSYIYQWCKYMLSFHFLWLLPLLVQRSHNVIESCRSVRVSHIHRKRKQFIILISYICIYFRGVWNSPFITAAYLIKKEILPKIKNSYGHHTLDPDMAFSQFLRNRVRYAFGDCVTVGLWQWCLGIVGFIIWCETDGVTIVAW